MNKVAFSFGIALIFLSIIFGIVLVSFLGQRNILIQYERDLDFMTNEKLHLDNQYQQLETTYQEYRDAHSIDNNHYTALSDAYNSYKSSHPYSQADYDAASFKFYYLQGMPRKYDGPYSLSSDLSGLTWNRAYEENIFDCSEMSASLERYLENLGWHTIIVVGNTPSNLNTRHAWLLVETSLNGYMPVEATSIHEIFWDNQYFNQYFVYDTQYETILDAKTSMLDQFDWWTVSGIPSK